MNTMNISGLLWPSLIGMPILALLFGKSQHRWLITELLMTLALLLAIAGLAIQGFNQGDALVSSIFNISLLNSTILLLISFIALVVLRYAKSNLAGDVDDARFLRWYIATVLAVVITVSTNNLAVFWLAWLSISLSLHQLLMFYPERPRAVLAAHKKYIFARVAEVLLGTAFLLLYSQHQTLVISEVLANLSSGQLSLKDQIAAILLANVALIKCAQLPLHGWLVQVVESPTPVSALLHAGIINMGGFLLLSFAPLFGQSLVAQWLVLIVAGISTVIAAMVMMTRISIKVRLAWSTIAQMGLMLIECGLGLYELALLHLVAHSCYKAHAFLNSGSAVNHYLHKQYASSSFPSFKSWSLGIFITTVVIAATILLLDVQAPYSPWVVIGIAISTLLAFRFNQAMKLPLIPSLLVGVLMLTIYVELKWGADLLVPGFIAHYNLLADVWIGSLFLGLMVVYFYLQRCSESDFSRKLFISLNAGFYLDEWASRITLQVWPIRIPDTAKNKNNLH